MESICPEFALFGSEFVRPRTDTVFFPISVVSKGTVSLKEALVWSNIKRVYTLLKYFLGFFFVTF